MKSEPEPAAAPEACREPMMGGLDEDCYPNLTCDDGLACNDGICAVAPLPGKISREQISKAIGAVRDDVGACGGAHPGRGTVRLRVRVLPSGALGNVRVEMAPTEELGNCVAKAVSSAVLPATQNGGEFTYPFVFR